MSAPKPVRPEPRPGILAIDTYVPGKSGRPGGGQVHKLSSHETPLGPSPAALAALHDPIAMLETYPDGRATVLRTAIAKRYGHDPLRTNGVDASLLVLPLVSQDICALGPQCFSF